eukprot:5214769-Karenia_brevis.AAC.1
MGGLHEKDAASSISEQLSIGADSSMVLRSAAIRAATAAAFHAAIMAGTDCAQAAGITHAMILPQPVMLLQRPSKV